MTKLSLCLLIVILLALGGGAWFVTNRETKPMPTAEEPTPAGPSETVQTYSSKEHGLSFSYPTRYFLTERAVGTPQTPQHAIILAEDSQENRDLFAGKVTEPREGPPTITIEIHQNPRQLSAEDWIRNSTNWTLSTQQVTPLTVNGNEGASFHWSGLYEGTSVVFIKEQRAYVVSVTRLQETDPIKEDYAALLNSLRLN